MNDLARVTASFLLGGVGLLYAFVIAFAFFIPFSIWSAARSLKHIRHELDRLNCNIESGRLTRDEETHQRFKSA